MTQQKGEGTEDCKHSSLRNVSKTTMPMNLDILISNVIFNLGGDTRGTFINGLLLCSAKQTTT